MEQLFHKIQYAWWRKFLADFNSTTLAVGQSYSHIFSQPGEFPYRDSTNADMTSDVIVRNQ